MHAALSPKGFKRVLALCAFFAGCAGGTPDGKPPPFRPEAVIEKKVLTGPEGVQVRLVQTEEAALVELTRVRDNLDGAVLLTELAGSTAERLYETQLNGRTSRLLKRKDRAWTLLVGGRIGLEVNEAASEKLEARELVDLHVGQRAKGRLAALSRFDRDGAQTYSESKLADSFEYIEDKCGFVPDTSIDFSKVTEAQLMRYSIYGYCDAPTSGLKRACDVPELKSYLSKAVKRFVCQFGDAPNLELAEGTLRFTVHFETSNQDQWAREALDKMTVEAGRTVRDVRIQSKTIVCAAPEGDGHVVVGPREDKTTAGVAYGTGTVLYRQPDRRYLPWGWFFEPRYPNPTHNDNFRGYDLRNFSFVETDEDKRCTLSCGTRKVPLREVTGKEKQKFLESAEWKPIPNFREPYALARDKRGRYYYVDRGATPETAKDFRLYLGPQGRLVLQKMKDIVSDSEGEIFASSRGRLKLFLGKNDAEWQSRRRTKKLVRVKVDENLPLIYNRLGVYIGQPLYTPCDDL